MKKILSFIVLLLTIFLYSCSSKIENEISIITPYGSPYIALGGLIGEENIKIDAVNGADNLKTALVGGEYDIVVAPVNLGATLFNKGNSSYKIAAVITMNNAYIVTKSENKLDNISDIENEKVLAFGQTGIPGSILKKVYSYNNFNIENIDFTFASSSAVYSVFTGGSSDAKYALLSEPEISKLRINDNIEVKTLSLCNELDTDVPQACIYVNPASEKQEDIKKVLLKINNNINLLNRNSTEYVKDIIDLDRVFSAMGEEILISSLPKMDIVYQKAIDSRNQIENILSILGVATPNDEFYY